MLSFWHDKQFSKKILVIFPFNWNPQSAPFEYATALPANVRLGWKCLIVTNILVYCYREFKTALK